MSRSEIKLTVRMPRELAEQLAEVANKNKRSMNGEIIWLLEQALTQQGES